MRGSVVQIENIPSGLSSKPGRKFGGTPWDYNNTSQANTLPIPFLSTSPPALPPVPHPGDLGLSHLPLELEDAVHEGLASRGATGDVNVDGDDSVAAADDAVAIVVVAAAVCAAAHADDPAGFGHLVIDLTHSGSHLVGQGAGDDHDIGLAGGGTENDTQAILVVPRGGDVHHLDGAAGETETEGPEGGLSAPVGDLVEGRQGMLYDAFGGLLAGQRDLAPWIRGEPGGGLGWEGGILFGTGGDRGGGLEGYDGCWFRGCDNEGK